VFDSLLIGRNPKLTIGANQIAGLNGLGLAAFW
jgi:hypothetical protein